MSKAILVLVIFLCCVGLSESTAQFVEFETSWKKAKKKSKKQGKPIIAIFPHWKYKSMERRVFDVDSITLALKEDFILYKHKKGNDKPWYIRGYPTIVISDHEGNRYKQMMYYYVKDSLLEEIRDFDQKKPLRYYENLYKEGENGIEFLEEYVSYALQYHLGLTGVYYDYYQRIDGFNCLKLQCVTQTLRHSLPTQEYLDNYEEMISLNCANEDIEDGLFGVFHRDYINIDRYDESRYSDYAEAANKTTEFLEEDDRYRDSLLVYHTWHFHKKRSYEVFTEVQNNKANSLLLECFRYNIENIYDRDSLQSFLFDLGVSINNKVELNRLVEIIKEKPIFINDAAIVEVLAIAFFRLGDNENGIKMISRANDIAYRNGGRYKTIIPEMKEKGLLEPVEE